MLASKGVSLSPMTVHRYMNKELGLRSVTRKKKRYRYVKGEAPYKTFDNLLKQNFVTRRRNETWCVDFTYLPLASGAMRYNCTIIDLYDRRVVASVCGRQITTQLAIDTLQKAIEAAGGKGAEILHSDRGSQFTSKEFIEFCREHGIRQSMSRPGCPYDNAVMERYFNTMKTELLYQHRYENEEELFKAITCYAHGWYNHLRPHTYNRNMPPCKNMEIH